MKSVTVLIAASSLLIYQTVLACTTYECKKQAALSDKTISEQVRNKLKVYYEQSDKLYNEYREKERR
jgi:hypothetical protein